MTSLYLCELRFPLPQRFQFFLLLFNRLLERIELLIGVVRLSFFFLDVFLPIEHLLDQCLQVGVVFLEYSKQVNVFEGVRIGFSLNLALCEQALQLLDI